MVDYRLVIWVCIWTWLFVVLVALFVSDCIVWVLNLVCWGIVVCFLVVALGIDWSFGFGLCDCLCLFEVWFGSLFVILRLFAVLIFCLRFALGRLLYVWLRGVYCYVVLLFRFVIALFLWWLMGWCTSLMFGFVFYALLGTYFRLITWFSWAANSRLLYDTFYFELLLNFWLLFYVMFDWIFCWVLLSVILLWIYVIVLWIVLVVLTCLRWFYLYCIYCFCLMLLLVCWFVALLFCFGVSCSFLLFDYFILIGVCFDLILVFCFGFIGVRCVVVCYLVCLFAVFMFGLYAWFSFGKLDCLLGGLECCCLLLMLTCLDILIIGILSVVGFDFVILLILTCCFGLVYFTLLLILI